MSRLSFHKKSNSVNPTITPKEKPMPRSKSAIPAHIRLSMALMREAHCDNERENTTPDSTFLPVKTFGTPSIKSITEPTVAASQMPALEPHRSINLKSRQDQ